MLPTTMFLTTEATPLETGLNSAGLLPQQAAEPSAEFADVLRMGLEPAQTTELGTGIPLPLTGNALPQIDITEFESVEAVGSTDAAESLAAAVEAELAVAVPLTPAAESMRPLPRDGAMLQAGAPVPRQFVPPTVVAQTAADGEPAAADFLAPRDRPVGESVSALPLQRSSIASQPGVVSAPPETRGTPIGDAVRELLAEARSPDRRSAPEIASREPVQPDRSSLLTAEAVRDAAARDVRTPQAAIPAASLTTLQSQAAPVAEVPTPQPAQSAAIQAGLTQTQPTHDSATTSAQLSQPIDVSVRDAAWGERVGERIVLMASNRLQSVEIRLSPAELGPLRVQVAVDDGAANVTFHAQHAVTREAIEQALPRLRELLAENGLTLNQTSVGESGGQGVQQGSRDGADNARAAASDAIEPDAEASLVDDGDAAGANARPDGLVDTFA